MVTASLLLDSKNWRKEEVSGYSCSSLVAAANILWCWEKKSVIGPNKSSYFIVILWVPEAY